MKPFRILTAFLVLTISASVTAQNVIRRPLEVNITTGTDATTGIVLGTTVVVPMIAIDKKKKELGVEKLTTEQLQELAQSIYQLEAVKTKEILAAEKQEREQKEERERLALEAVKKRIASNPYTDLPKSFPVDENTKYDENGIDSRVDNCVYYQARYKDNGRMDHISYAITESAHEPIIFRSSFERDKKEFVMQFETKNDPRSFLVYDKNNKLIAPDQFKKRTRLQKIVDYQDINITGFPPLDVDFGTLEAGKHKSHREISTEIDSLLKDIATNTKNKFGTYTEDKAHRIYQCCGFEDVEIKRIKHSEKHSFQIRNSLMEKGNPNSPSRWDSAVSSAALRLQKPGFAKFREGAHNLDSRSRKYNLASIEGGHRYILSQLAPSMDKRSPEKPCVELATFPKNTKNDTEDTMPSTH